MFHTRGRLVGGVGDLALVPEKEEGTGFLHNVCARERGRSWPRCVFLVCMHSPQPLDRVESRGGSEPTVGRSPFALLRVGRYKAQIAREQEGRWGFFECSSSGDFVLDPVSKPHAFRHDAT